ncbi:MAG: hypothetical protein HYX67_10375 [Candidatus Melainabacteria bacterium]|nr:hypothetical protein [Candidatus Melainabacteria bacterium]
MTNPLGPSFFDLLPNEMLHPILAEALKGEKAFNGVDCRFRDANFVKECELVKAIVQRAQTHNTVLDRHVRTLGNPILLTHKDTHAFFESIVKKAREFGVQCPMKVVAPEEIDQLSQQAQDHALEQIWKHIGATVPISLQLVPSFEIKAPEIRRILNDVAFQPVLQNLTSLNLYGANLKILPPEIKLLTALQVLNLSYNKFENVPSEIGMLTWVTELNLRGNQLRTLPPEMGQLSLLNSLDLSENSLSDLPLEMRQLSALQSLEISNNRFQKLPSAIWGMTSLTSLYAKENQIIIIPALIDQLVLLEKLDLGHNKIVSVGIPSSIGQHTQLRELNLSHNRIATLPQQINDLSNLSTLDLRDNRLHALPFDTLQPGQLPALSKLVLANNKLTAVPAQMGPNLSELNLSGNPLSSLPQNFGSSLHYLNLSNTGLRSFPLEILSLVDLKLLNLNNNKIEQLPENISSLANLSTLYLSDNSLSDLPKELGQLKQLDELWLTHNRFQEIPSVIDELQLSMLLMNDNRISSIPDFIRNKEYESFGLRNNPIENYPAFLSWIKPKWKSSRLLLSVSYSLGVAKDDNAFKEAFFNMPQVLQNRVHKWVWNRSGRPLTPDLYWGEHHVFDNMDIFKKALINGFLELDDSFLVNLFFWTAERSRNSIPSGSLDPIAWVKLHACDNEQVFRDVLLAAYVEGNKYSAASTDNFWDNIHSLDELTAARSFLMQRCMQWLELADLHNDKLKNKWVEIGKRVGAEGTEKKVLDAIRLWLFGDGTDNIPPYLRKDAVFRAVYFLSGRPQTDDLQWGEHNALRDPAILMQAIDIVLNESVTI